MAISAPIDRTVKGICDAVMESFCAGLDLAERDAPINRARASLGRDRFIDAASVSLRRRVAELLTGDRLPELKEWMREPTGEGRFIADVIAGAYQDIIKEAGLPTPTGPA